MTSKPNYSLMLVVISLIFFVFLSAIRLQYPELSHGDDWADANALNSGENMARLGMAISHGLAIHRPMAKELQPVFKPYDTNDPLAHFGTYTRNPPFYTAVNAFLRYCGLESSFSFRFVMICLSFISVTFFYLFVKKCFNLHYIGEISVFFYICNPFFISGFDSLNNPVYMDLFRNISLFLMANLAVCNSGQFKIKIALIYFLFILQALTTYEYIVFLSVFILFFIYFKRVTLSRMRLLIILLLPTAFVIGFLIHFFLVSWHIGSIKEAFIDRLITAISRMVGDPRTLASEPLDWGVWFHSVGIRFPLQVLFFPLSTVLVGIAAALLLKTGEKKPTTLHKSMALALALGFSGYAWYLVMPAQCLDHAGLSWLQRHLVPGVAVLFGGIFYTFLLQLLKDGWNPIKAHIVIYAFIIAAGVTSILGSELPITREKIAVEREFERIVTSLRQTAPYLEYEDYVGMNVFRPTNAFTYYLKARTLHIPNAMAFEALEKKPSVFLLVPINGPETQNLADLLSKNYRVAFVADNKRLPFYVFVKND